MIFPGVIRRQIQGEGKFASHALGADHIDILAVCLDDLFRDSKAEACAFFIFSSKSCSAIVPHLSQDARQTSPTFPK